MLKETDYRALSINPMTLISDEWMLITAGTEERGYNTMTACWGTMGAIWGAGKGLPVTSVLIRPQRYTKEFVDREELYTLSFFPPEYKKALGYLGSHSGRDEDKISKAGLTPAFGDGFTYFEEARLVLVCRKLFRSTLQEEDFLDKEVMEKNYPLRDFHDLYIGQIVKVLKSEE